MFLPNKPPYLGKTPKDKDKEGKAKALREKTEKVFDSASVGLPLEAWQVLKGVFNYTLPSKDVLRSFAEDDLTTSGETGAISENQEVA